MTVRILIKRSNTPGKLPAAVQLALGEVVCNTADAKSWVINSSGAVVETTGTSAPGAIGQIGPVGATGTAGPVGSAITGIQGKVGPTGPTFVFNAT